MESTSLFHLIYARPCRLSEQTTQAEEMRINSRKKLFKNSRCGSSCVLSLPRKTWRPLKWKCHKTLEPPWVLSDLCWFCNKMRTLSLLFWVTETCGCLLAQQNPCYSNHYVVDWYRSHIFPSARKRLTEWWLQVQILAVFAQRN